MKIKIEMTEMDLKFLIAERLTEMLGEVSISMDDVKLIIFGSDVRVEIEGDV